MTSFIRLIGENVLSFCAYLGQLLLLDAELGLGIFQRQNPAIAPDGIGAKIGNHGQSDGRHHQNTENAGDRTLDSHSPNESHTDSRCQQRFR